MKTLSSLDVSNKKVIVRGDLDVAMEDGQVTEDYRLEALVPTLNYLLEKDAAVVLIGHLGRPEGHDEDFSLAPVIDRLSELLEREILFINNWLDDPQAVLDKIESETVVALENLRFDPRELENDDDFAQMLSQFGELFINDSFAAHREQASTIAITKHMPSYAGLRFEQEIKELTKLRENPERPLVVLMGGGKADTKIPFVSEFGSFADHILLGGKLMYATELEGVKGVRFAVDAVRVDDIGPKSIELFKEYLEKANTIIWNGPVGRFEDEEYAAGTRAMAEIVAEQGAYKVIGGGDTIAALDEFGYLDKMDFVSTGGGAMLNFLADGTLPALEALNG